MWKKQQTVPALLSSKNNLGFNYTLELLAAEKTLQEKLQMAEIGRKCRVLAFLLHFWKHTQNSEFQLNFVSSSSVLPLRQSHNSCYLLKLCTSVVRGNLKCSVPRNTLLKAGLIRVCVEIWANLSEKAKFCPAKQAELKFQEKWKRKQKMESTTCNLSLTVWNDPCFNHPGRKKNLRRVHVNVWQQGVIWKEFYCAIVGELSPEFVWGQSQKVWAFELCWTGPLSYWFKFAVAPHASERELLRGNAGVIIIDDLNHVSCNKRRNKSWKAERILPVSGFVGQ